MQLTKPERRQSALGRGGQWFGGHVEQRWFGDAKQRDCHRDPLQPVSRLGTQESEPPRWSPGPGHTKCLLPAPQATHCHSPSPQHCEERVLWYQLLP